MDDDREDDIGGLSVDSRRVAQSEILKNLKSDISCQEEMLKEFSGYAKHIVSLALTEWRRHQSSHENPADDNEAPVKKSDTHEKLRVNLFKLIRQEQEVRGQIKAMQACVQTIRRADLEQDLPDVEQLLEEERKKLPEEYDEEILKRSNLYKRWAKKFDEQVEDEDGITMMNNSDTLTTKCPITQAPITLESEPLRNKECGHIYSKAGILGFLGNSRGKPCPVAACNKYVDVSSLERDEEYEEELRDYIRNKQRGGGGRIRRTVVDSDED